MLEKSASMAINLHRFFPAGFKLRRRSPSHTIPAIGSFIASGRVTFFDARGTGAVVDTVMVTTESPLPIGTDVGLKEQVVNPGRLDAAAAHLPLLAGEGVLPALNI